VEDFIVDNFRIFAPVRIGAVSGYAQIDTGANPSFVRRSFSTDFQRVGTGEIRGALRMTAVEQCRLGIVSFLGYDFSDVVVNIQSDDAGDFQGLPFQVVMTIGVDILYQKPLYLNFVEGQIGFLEVVPSEWEVRGQVVDLHFKSGLAFFKTSLGSYKLNALFDTGAGFSVLNAKCLDMLRADLIEQEPEETLDPTGAKALIPVYKYPSLEINGRSIGEIRFLVMDLADVEKAIGMEVDIVFGFDTMASYNWVVGKSQKRLLMIR